MQNSSIIVDIDDLNQRLFTGECSVFHQPSQKFKEISKRYIRAIWKKSVHIRNPFVYLDFSTNRTKSAFARHRNLANLFRMNREGKSHIAKTIRFPAV